MIPISISKHITIDMLCAQCKKKLPKFKSFPSILKCLADKCFNLYQYISKLTTCERQNLIKYLIMLNLSVLLVTN